ncbi:response regulator [Desulfatirhabdium butyrativorans]|uniref:response regulator n=1 Tax=Desulfatirhabdium butyrativorans TaxID=340467 RepID=UPI0003F80501|nr:response regulator [Desulfatirhabdium butyrativorans]
MNILIVDDKPDNLYLLEVLLKANGHTILSAANGEEALQTLQTEGVDLIVSDILMPVMDGFQLCRRIRADERLRHIPFIVYTATYTGPKDEEFALKIGADSFLLKPCEPDVFMATIDEVMAASRSRDPSRAPAPAPEGEVLKLYSERLVRKLEKKMVDLEAEIQERKRIQEELRQSEEKYRTLVENAEDIVCILQDGQFKFQNQRFEALLGYNPGELINQDFMELICAEDRAMVMERIRRILDGDPRGTPISYRIVHKTGQFIWASSTASRVMWEGRPALLTFIRNITRQKEIEEQFHHAQRLESVGRLAGGVAHDFNNMLGVIIGYAELAKLKIDPQDPLSENLEEILMAARRSIDITRQLLAFARKQATEPKVLDLNRAVEDMLKMLRRLIGEDIDLSWKPGESLGLIRIDPSQVDQILANLCVNARDAISGVGKIVIQTENARFGKDYCMDHPDFIPGEYVLLMVSDTGCGMSRETMARLFEPFFTTKEVGKGTGLGLATVYGIVKQNGGFIHVYSEPGMGTTFRIYLPRHSEAAPLADAEVIGESAMGHGELVLLVEDEPAILNMGKQMLETLGYRVLATADTDEAMTLAERHAGQISLLITDMIMPKMNGHDLAARLCPRYPGLKTLFISGYTTDIIDPAGLCGNGVHFLQKPFSVHQLATSVRKTLENSP